MMVITSTFVIESVSGIEFLIYSLPFGYIVPLVKVFILTRLTLEVKLKRIERLALNTSLK